MSSIQPGPITRVPFDISAADVSAGTPFDFICPVDGFMGRFTIIIQTAIVTGGVVNVKNNVTDIPLATITVADAATKGSIQTVATAKGEPLRAVTKGQRMQIVHSAAFNGGGAISGDVAFFGLDALDA
jgi:hypothetical protein